MNLYDNMLELCDSENIIFSYEDFQLPLNGIYISCDGMHTIMLSNRIKDNHPLRNVILAEEIGHHFTLVGSNIPHEHWNRLNRINFTKDESRAIRWAANYIMPKEKLISVINHDNLLIPEIAEYFEVTYEFTIYRLSLSDIQMVKYQAVI